MFEPVDHPRFVFAHRRFGVVVYFDTKNDKLVVQGMRPTMVDGSMAFLFGPFLWTGWPRKGRDCRGMYTTPVDEDAAKPIFINDWVESVLHSTVHDAEEA